MFHHCIAQGPSALVGGAAKRKARGMLSDIVASAAKPPAAVRNARWVPGSARVGDDVRLVADVHTSVAPSAKAKFTIFERDKIGSDDKITEHQAKGLRDHTAERVEAFVRREFSFGPKRFRGHGFHRFGHGDSASTGQSTVSSA